MSFSCVQCRNLFQSQSNSGQSSSSASSECSFSNGYRNDAHLPVYRTGKQAFASKEVVEVLMKPPQDKICSKKPTFIEDDVTFIVDLAKLADVKDLTADGNGSYLQHGVHVLHMAMQQKENSHFKQHSFPQGKL